MSKWLMKLAIFLPKAGMLAEADEWNWLDDCDNRF